MLFQLAACVESFEANVTLEGTFTIVPHLVLLFRLRTWKTHTADLAFEGIKAQMLINMSVERVLCSIAFIAVHARVANIFPWLFIRLRLIFCSEFNPLVQLIYIPVNAWRCSMNIPVMTISFI